MIGTTTTTNASVAEGHPSDGRQYNMRVEGLGVHRWVGSQSRERSLTIGVHSPKGKAAAPNGSLSPNPIIHIGIRTS